MSRLVLIVLALVFTGAASATTLSDDFERATLGTNWKSVAYPSGIINNSDLGLFSGIFGIVYWSHVIGMPSDQFSQGEISAGLPSDVFSRGVFVRRNATSKARYQLHFDFNGTDADPTPQWQLKYDGVPDAHTRLLAVSYTPGVPQAGDLIRIEAQGSKIRGYLNGQLILSAMDGVLTGGSPGLSFTTAGIPISQPEPAFESWQGGSL